MNLVRKICIVIILFFSVNHEGFSKPVKHILDFFYSLPDSIFTKNNYCFNSEKDSFPFAERKSISFVSSDSAYSTNSNNRHFLFFEISDSIGKLTFGIEGSQTSTISILETKGREVFFVIESMRCDFVACPQKWNFYIKKGNKITVVQNVIPEIYPAYLFFPKSYLDSMNVDSLTNINGVEIQFTSSPALLKIRSNVDYFDPELFGTENPMVKLDPVRLNDDSLILILYKRKFLIGHFVYPTFPE